MSSGISIGLSGIIAAKYAMHTVGNNITNAATEGYARREVKLSTDNSAISAGGGSGVSIEGVIRRRDIFLEGRLLEYAGKAATHDIQHKYFTEIEGLLQEPGDDGIGVVIEEFFNQWQSVAGNSQDVTERAVLSLTAGQLADRLNDLRAGLLQLRNDVFAEVGNVVNNVNSLTDSIAYNNQLILNANSTSGGELALQDNRDGFLREVAALIGSSNATATGRETTLIVNGAIIVSGNAATTIYPPTDYNSMLTIGSENDGADMPVTDGRLGGLMNLMHTVIPGMIDDLDNFAVDLMRAVDSVHAEGLGLGGRFSSIASTRVVMDVDLSGNPGDDLLVNAGLPFTPTAGNLVINVYDNAAQASTAETLAINPAAQSLDDIAAAISAISHLSAVSSNGTLTITAESGYGFDFCATQGTDVLAALGINTFFQGKNSADIQVSAAIADDPTKIACAQSTNPSDGSNSLRIGELRDSAVANGSTATITESWRNYVVDIGNQTNNAGRSRAMSQSMYEVTNKQEQSISGVSLDEEATKLIEYQQLFNSCAKYISIVAEMNEYLLTYV